MFFTSCGEETTSEAPIITLDQTSPVTAVAGSVLLTGEIIAEAKLDQVKLFIVTGDAETQYGTAYTSFKSGDITTDDDLNYDFRITVTGITESCAIKIEATDKDNQTSARSIDVTAGGPIASYTFDLGSYSAATGSSFASIDGTVYTWANATANSGKVDFVFFYGSSGGSNLATLAAPNDTEADKVFDFSGWATQNATKFKTTSVTATEFDAITNDTDILAAASGASASLANNLSVGDVVAFVTAATSAHPNKSGLVKVVSITGTGGTATINLAAKVQE